MKKRINDLALGGVAAIAMVISAPAQAQSQANAQSQSIALRDSFPIGTGGLCEAQILAPESGAGMFDRRYAVLCRDAAAPVGTLWVVRDQGDAGAATRFAPSMDCQDTQRADIPGPIGDARQLSCGSSTSGVQQSVLFAEFGGRTYAASGVTVYQDALKLGLAALAADRPVAGEVSIPLTQATDAAAFARQQAEAISADAALVEAYRRSNSGSFAEAAEFFAASASELTGSGAAEASLNAALQQSNLGNYLEAARLFNLVQSAVAVDPVLGRMERNFRALDALNRNSSPEALAILDRPLPQSDDALDGLTRLELQTPVAQRLAAEQASVLSEAGQGLTPLERAQLLDGQADYIRASAFRQQGNVSAAAAALVSADTQLSSVRGGRINSILWLRSQVLAELAELAELRGNYAESEGLHQQAVTLLETNYPGSPALLSARSQLAGLYARTGRTEEALAVYRDLVGEVESRPTSSLRRLLAPYFELLAENDSGTATAEDMFAASQLLLRPGLAQTQAILARELSGGSDEASQLFRKALNLGRSVEKARGTLVQLEARLADNPQLAPAVAERQEQLAQLQELQLETQQALSAYPRYRVVNDDRMTLGVLQETLRDGEAYVKLAALDDAAYAIFATKDGARGYKLGATPDELEVLVDVLRASIVVIEDGQSVTYPFDIEASRDLFNKLFAPVAGDLQGVTHLVFEPDGALLRLPVNLLVMDDASVERYATRVDEQGGDPYDYTGTAWLGRAMQVSTTVSPSAFRDVRAAPRSNATGDYIGFGENTPVGEIASDGSNTRAAMLMSAECAWQPGTWNDPIAATELRSASSLFSLTGSGTEIVTGDRFTDTAVTSRTDLDEYRVLHFATHGLVTAPKAQCPPRPALLTSFGDGDSDGLLSFSEIYDLQIDADLVILSACDTAGTATVGLTREAGVTSGGDFALDGLVRAFVGAGGRSVVASHWPVPDDYNATERLITGLFEAAPGTATAQAMQISQLDLMDDADTSHPFYWSAFAIVGDGSVPVRR
ncbi:CHAT domain-containing protein [Sphingomonadaceae bacterium]|nr:CHAT domain-containing protein [Sphingomonadaceae bacterium]